VKSACSITACENDANAQNTTGELQGIGARVWCSTWRANRAAAGWIWTLPPNADVTI